MDRKTPKQIIVDPRGPRARTLVPTPEQVRELEAAVLESLMALDDERLWEPVDDSSPESGTFVIDDR